MGACRRSGPAWPEASWRYRVDGSAADIVTRRTAFERGAVQYAVCHDRSGAVGILSVHASGKGVQDAVSFARRAQFEHGTASVGSPARVHTSEGGGSVKRFLDVRQERHRTPSIRTAPKTIKHAVSVSR